MRRTARSGALTGATPVAARDQSLPLYCPKENAVSVTKLSLAALPSEQFTPLTELPPFAAFLDGTTVGYVHLAGPVTESGFLLAGTAVIRDADGQTKLQAGDGYVLPAGFTGTFEVKDAVTKLFYVL